MWGRVLPRNGLPFALLALIVQLAVGGFVPNSVDLLAAQVAPLCVSGPDGKPVPKAPPRHLPDLLPNPLFAASVTSAVALPVVPPLLPPVQHALPRPELPPPATAPPAPHRLAAHPRGPPVFLA